jgi:hypothetical protein
LLIPVPKNAEYPVAIRASTKGRRAPISLPSACREFADSGQKFGFQRPRSYGANVLVTNDALLVDQESG